MFYVLCFYSSLIDTADQLFKRCVEQGANCFWCVDYCLYAPRKRRTRTNSKVSKRHLRSLLEYVGLNRTARNCIENNRGRFFFLISRQHMNRLLSIYIARIVVSWRTKILYYHNEIKSRLKFISFQVHFRVWLLSIDLFNSELVIRSLSQTIMSLKDELKGFISFHSFSQLWLTPWAYTTKYPADHKELMDVANEATR